MKKFYFIIVSLLTFFTLSCQKKINAPYPVFMKKIPVDWFNILKTNPFFMAKVKDEFYLFFSQSYSKKNEKKITKTNEVTPEIIKKAQNTILKINDVQVGQVIKELPYNQFVRELIQTLKNEMGFDILKNQIQFVDEIEQKRDQTYHKLFKFSYSLFMNQRNRILEQLKEKQRITSKEYSKLKNLFSRFDP